MGLGSFCMIGTTAVRCLRVSRDLEMLNQRFTSGEAMTSPPHMNFDLILIDADSVNPKMDSSCVFSQVHKSVFQVGGDFELKYIHINKLQVFG